MSASPTITCGLCGRPFPLDQARGCQGCGRQAVGNCHQVHCPYCGYPQTPPARLPQLLGRLLAPKRTTRPGKSGGEGSESNC
jgi:hypothetical protein